MFGRKARRIRDLEERLARMTRWYDSCGDEVRKLVGERGAARREVRRLTERKRPEILRRGW